MIKSPQGPDGGHCRVENVASRITADNAARAVELANLPDLVRGYEQIKLDNVETYRSELARLKSVLA